jgi:hypothetical protein
MLHPVESLALIGDVKMGEIRVHVKTLFVELLPFTNELIGPYRHENLILNWITLPYSRQVFAILSLTDCTGNIPLYS